MNFSKKHKQAYSVCLVEDQTETREHLAIAINDHPNLVLALAADTIAQATECVKFTRPDVLLTDLGLPDGHGTQLIQLATQNKHTQSIVITVFGDEESLVDAISAGASGYLLKDSQSVDIGRSIIDMINGGSPISPAIARHLLKRYTEPPSTNIQDCASGKKLLTKREREVLRYIVKGFTYAEIAELLSISVHTITSHIKNIYKKLSVNSRGEAVFEAMQLGLVETESN